MRRSPRFVALLVPALVVGMSLPAVAQQARQTDLACPPGAVPRAGFADTAGNTHEQAIDCAAHHGVTTGVTPDRYGPELPVRRDQMATFIARTLESSGYPLPTDPPHRFADVPADGTHTLRINQLAALGIVGGFGDGTYRPAAPVRRDQMASFIHRAVEQATGIGRAADGDWFDDVDGNTHEGSIKVLAAEGVVAGFGDGTYRPALDVRRDQMASFLMRALDLIFEDGFSFATAFISYLIGGAVVDDSEEEPAFNQGQLDGFGFAFLVPDSESGQLCYGLGLILDGEVTAARIHRGATDATGPAVLDLQPDVEGDCVDVGGLAAEIEEHPQRFYVQVHTESFPQGAVRAQVGLDPAFSALSWGNVLAETDGGPVLGLGDRDLSAAAFVQSDPDTGVVCSVALVESVSSPLTGHHIYAGRMHEAGTLLASFGVPQPVEHPELPGETVWIAGTCEQPGTAVAGALTSNPGGHFVLVESEEHPEGAGRGQLNAQTVEVPLSWEDEVDDQGAANQGEPGATGVAVLQMDFESGQLCSYVETDATGPFTGNHIHRGEAGENGPIVIGLATPDDDTGVVSACQHEDPGELLSVVFDPWGHYLNVHTQAHPAGAVRGQLGAGFDQAEEEPWVEEPASDPGTVFAQLLHRRG